MDKKAWTPDRVKNLRRKLGWSLSELSRRLGCGKELLESFELGEGELNYETLTQIDQLAHHVESHFEKTSQRPLADLLLKEKGLTQVASQDVSEPEES